MKYILTRCQNPWRHNQTGVNPLIESGKTVQKMGSTSEEFSKPSFGNKGVFADENFYGASLWHPPGVHFNPEELSSSFADIPEDRIENVVKFFNELEKFNPNEDHWYLSFIALDPSKQGMGLGSLILKEALQVIDEQGKLAYLQSSNPKNISLYLRHGFEVIGEIQVGSSPVMTPMIRNPQ